MGEVKKYTLDELKEKLTEKERLFCHQYIIDWNGARAAREAGYSEESAKQIAHENLTKLYLVQYIDFIKNDFEKEAGISKLMIINELKKLAFSSIAHLHNTWIELKAFEDLTKAQKDSIEIVDTKHETKQIFDIENNTREDINVNYVKIKLHSKLSSMDMINKLQGYYDAEKIDHSSKDGSMTPILNINYNDKKINLSDK